MPNTVGLARCALSAVMVEAAGTCTDDFMMPAKHVSSIVLVPSSCDATSTCTVAPGLMA